MGWTYAHLVLFGANQKEIAAALRNRDAVISPTINDFSLIADKEFEGGDVQAIRLMAERLSKELKCPAMAVMEFDDDVLWYQLVQDGAIVDEYNSEPDYFDFEGKHDPPRGPQGGSASKVCEAFQRPDKSSRVEAVLRLRDLTLSAPERHRQLSEILGMPGFSVGFDYAAIQDGELPDGLNESALLFITGPNQY